ncbi:MAG: Ig-like domain-containing protein, partial [Planctomycetota bacterium]
GAVTIGLGSIDRAGKTTIMLNNLAVGQHSITATYNGDGNFNPSTGTLAQSVNKADTQVTVATSASPTEIGEPVTFTGIISPVAPGAASRRV